MPDGAARSPLNRYTATFELNQQRYQFYETERRRLSLESAPSYVDENFKTNPDQQFFGLRWAANYEQALLAGDGLR